MANKKEATIVFDWGCILMLLLGVASLTIGAAKGYSTYQQELNEYKKTSVFVDHGVIIRYTNETTNSNYVVATVVYKYKTMVGACLVKITGTPEKIRHHVNNYPDNSKVLGVFPASILTIMNREQHQFCVMEWDDDFSEVNKSVHNQ
jgi:hypothetical protein